MTKPSKNLDRASGIMVVDDTPANLQLLTGMLKEHGYKVRPVPSGKLALAAAENEPPDLILLDIKMPEMDGYEVCRQLKADAVLKEIPVIFLSALNETMDKVKAFSVGGVDYMTKPFQFEEVMARVKAHLTIRALQTELEQRNRQLEDSLRRLQELEQLRDNLTHMIVHDLRSPLSGICVNLDFVLHNLKNDRLGADDLEALKDANSSSLKLSDMIAAMLDVSRLEANQMPLNKTAADLRELAQSALKLVRSTAKERVIKSEIPGDSLVCRCDAEVIARVIRNLLENAVKYSPAGKEIELRLEHKPGLVRVSVMDQGRGIPPEYHSKIFEKFGRVEIEKREHLPSIGLGLTFCKLAVEAHGGKIGLESEPDKGSTFWFELPEKG